MSAAKKPAAKKAAAKKPAARKPAAKVHPLRGMHIDDWASRMTGWQAEALAAIRAVITQHAPGATAEIKWGHPVWYHHGPFAFFKPAKAHALVGLWRGAELPDPAKIIRGDKQMRHVRLESAADAKSPALAALLRQAIRINEP